MLQQVRYLPCIRDVGNIRAEIQFGARTQAVQTGAIERFVIARSVNLQEVSAAVVAKIGVVVLQVPLHVVVEAFLCDHVRGGTHVVAVAERVFA